MESKTESKTDVLYEKSYQIFCKEVVEKRLLENNEIL
jgi:hypothetical protein